MCERERECLDLMGDDLGSLGSSKLILELLS